MKLTRVVHSTVTAFYGPAGDLLPDLAPLIGSGGADHLLLFTDADTHEAHGFLMSVEDARQLARAILGLEVARVVPPGLNGGG